MSDIFISYAHADREIARNLASTLESLGWQVWWDRTILAGETFDELIEKALDNARCVIVMWSADSIASRWVRTEAEEAARRNVLVPILIEQVKIPLAFRRIQAENMSGWDGTVQFGAFVKLKAALTQILGDAPADVEAARRAEEQARKEAQEQERKAQEARAAVEAEAQRREEATRKRLQEERQYREHAARLEKPQASARTVTPEESRPKPPATKRQTPVLLPMVAGGLLFGLAGAAWYGSNQFHLRVQSKEAKLTEVAQELEKSRQTTAQLREQVEAADREKQEWEEKRKAAEEARKKEEARKAAEAARKKEEEQRRAAEATRIQEEERKLAEAGKETTAIPATLSPGASDTKSKAAGIVPAATPQGKTGGAKEEAPLKQTPPQQTAAANAMPAVEATAKEEPVRLATAQQKEPSSLTKTLLLAPGTVFRDKLKDGSEGPEMIVIPNGTFLMGNNDGGPKEGPAHKVSLAKPFAMAIHEVTYAEFDKFARATNRDLPEDKGRGRGTYPVTNVSWADANAYAKWLSEQTGALYRLPNEAEWEYSARAGSDSDFWWGNRVGRKRANCNGCRSDWDGKQAAPVGSFKANDFGIADTVGNVWEWVRDCWNESYKGAPADGSAWLGGKCETRVIRGGSWMDSPDLSRSTVRIMRKPEIADSVVGFRICREL